MRHFKRKTGKPGIIRGEFSGYLLVKCKSVTYKASFRKIGRS